MAVHGLASRYIDGTLTVMSVHLIGSIFIYSCCCRCCCIFCCTCFLYMGIFLVHESWAISVLTYIFRTCIFFRPPVHFCTSSCWYCMAASRSFPSFSPPSSCEHRAGRSHHIYIEHERKEGQASKKASMATHCCWYIYPPIYRAVPLDRYMKAGGGAGAFAAGCCSWKALGRQSYTRRYRRRGVHASISSSNVHAWTYMN